MFVNVWVSGRDPSIWSNADLFIPERFLNEWNLNHHMLNRGIEKLHLYLKKINGYTR
ncbi:hypothetical protein ACS0TY_027680 [Phlomoides rotata]